MPVTFTVTSGGAIASVTGNTVSLSDTAFGTVTIRATQVGNDSVKAALAVSRSFTVNRKSNVISFPRISIKKLLDTDFALSATSSSGLPVTYTITSGGSIASVLGDSVSLTNTAIGTVTIRATQAGNDTVNAARTVYSSFTVSKATQTITWTPIPNKITTDNSFVVTATASSGLPTVITIFSGPATVSGDTVSITGAVGTVRLRAAQAGDNTYAAAADSYISFAVSVAPSLISPNDSEALTSTPELDLGAKTFVYPNPSNGFVNLSSDKILKSVNVYNTLGSLVFSNSFQDAAFKQQLNLIGLPKGLYMIVLVTKDGESINKIIIE